MSNRSRKKAAKKAQNPAKETIPHFQNSTAKDDPLPSLIASLNHLHTELSRISGMLSQGKESVSGSDDSKVAHERPGEPQPAIIIRSATKSSPTKAADSKRYKEATRKFENRYLLIQVFLLLVTAGAFFAALRYAKIASDANDLTHLSIVATQRAYLAAGSIEVLPLGISVHITNFGHIPAIIIGGTVEYMRFESSSDVNKSDRIFPIKISPFNRPRVMPGAGTDYQLLIHLPVPPDPQAIINGSQELAMLAKVEYDFGFGNTDQLIIPLHTDPKTKMWSLSGVGSRIVIPPESGPVKPLPP